MREKEVKILERAFKIRFNIEFPPSYRQFLLEKGSAVIDGYQIFGLPPKEEKEGILLPFWPGDPKSCRHFH